MARLAKSVDVDAKLQEIRNDYELKLLAILFKHRDKAKLFFEDSQSLDYFSDEKRRDLAELIREHWQKPGVNEPLGPAARRAWSSTYKSKGDKSEAELAFSEVNMRTGIVEPGDFHTYIDYLAEWRSQVRFVAAGRSLGKVNADAAVALFKRARRAAGESPLTAAEYDAFTDEANALASGYIPSDLISLGGRKAKRIDWLWRDRFPLGAVVLIGGVQGDGKSMLTCDLVARLTTGSGWPDGSPCPIGDALIINAEDDIDRVLVPRLEAAGANLDRVSAMTMVTDTKADGSKRNRMFTLADVDRLDRELTQRPAIRLVIIDPVGAFLSGRDENRSAEIQQLFAPLADLAMRRGICILMVGHLNKGKGTRALYRVMGSNAFTSSVRAAFLLTPDNADRDRRLFASLKSNWASQPPTLAYRIQAATVNAEDGESIGTARIVWDDGSVDVTADEAMAANEEQPDTQLRMASDWLREYLTGGCAKATDVYDAAKAQGIAERTLKRAKDAVGVKSYRIGFGGVWNWKLPNVSDDADDDGRAEVTAADSAYDW